MSQALDGWLKERGYRSQRRQGTFWYRPCGREYILLWIQLDKYGYDPHLGGKLWLNYCAGKEVTKTLQRGQTVPPSTVCSPAQLRQWFAAKRAILDKVLQQPDLGLAGDFFRRHVEWDKEQPYQQGSLAEMPYLDEADVRRWIDQSWGTREFYVEDPDGNTLRFTQGFPLPPVAQGNAEPGPASDRGGT